MALRRAVLSESEEVRRGIAEMERELARQKQRLAECEGLTGGGQRQAGGVPAPGGAPAKPKGAKKQGGKQGTAGSVAPPVPPPQPSVPWKRRFFDIAVNFTDPMFQGEYRGKQVHEDDRERVLQRSAEAGCTKWLVTGGNLEESREAIELCRRYRGNRFGVELRCTVGCHPTRCQEFESGATTLAGLAELIEGGVADGVVAAVGECGLDYDREEFCPRDVQKKWFAAQLELAHRFGLPLFLHNRSTGGDFEAVLEAHRDIFTRGCSHSFTGDAAELQRLLALGVHVGLNGCSLRAEHSEEMVKALPAGRLLLETDAPWCDIRPTHPSFQHVRTQYDAVKSEKKFVAGKTVKNRQEPCHIVQVFEVVCAWKGITTPEDVKAAEDMFYDSATSLYF